MKSKRNRLCNQGGQAMVESVFAIILTSLIFLAVFQYAQLFSSKIILTHAAARAARARTVGFNRWMMLKSARVAAIPASGRRLVPAYSGVDPAITAALRQNRIGDIWEMALRSDTRSPGIMLERGRVPEYMGIINAPTADHLLDYELWENLSVEMDEGLSMDGTMPSDIEVNVRMRHPLLLSMSALIDGEPRDAEDGEDIAIRGFFRLENHYPLYIEDANW